MSALMKVAALADGREFSQDMWVKSFDVDAVPSPHKGSWIIPTGAIVNGVFGGTIELTVFRDKALRFDTNADAMIAWKRISITRPRRPDGRPNRPLSALTVAIEPV